MEHPQPLAAALLLEVARHSKELEVELGPHLVEGVHLEVEVVLVVEAIPLEVDLVVVDLVAVAVVVMEVVHLEVAVEVHLAVLVEEMGKNQVQVFGCHKFFHTWVRD